MRIPQVILFAHNARLRCLVVVRVSLALAGLLSWQAYALAESATPVANAPSLMPETLSNIRLGVTQAELLRSRPAISGSNLEEDDSGPATLLFESVQSEFIDSVIYFFEDVRPILTSVALLKQLPVHSAHMISAFRIAVLKKWGLPDSVGYGRTKSGGRDISMVLKKKDAIVIASYPANNKIGMPDIVSVRIGLRDSVMETYANRLANMEKDAQAKLMAEFRDQLNQAPTASTYK